MAGRGSLPRGRQPQYLEAEEKSGAVAMDLPSFGFDLPVDGAVDVSLTILTDLGGEQVKLRAGMA